MHQRALNLRGDPGILGALAGGALGFLTGGPVGAFTGAAYGWGGAAPAATPMPGLPPIGNVPGPMGMWGGTVPITSVPGVTGLLQQAVPGGATGYQVTLPAAAAGATGPQGYHLNKTGYFTRGGYVAPRSKWVRNRSRNVSNGRANMRALRRLKAWDSADRNRRKALKQIAK